MIAWHIPAQPLQRRPTDRSEGLEEGDVDLHRHRELGRGLKHAACEALDSVSVARQPVGQGIQVRIDAQAQRRAQHSLPRAQAFQRRTDHAVVAPAGAAIGTGWRAGAWAALRRSASGLSELAA